jgi:murein DD-endopeptidase MepM/ murein hydrolase activator NlpD
MNLIVFCRSTRGTRHLALSPPLLAGLAGSAAAIMLAAFGLGYGAARLGGYVPGDERIVELEQAIADQKASIARARATAQDQVNALAIRLGELNSHVIRLNALGGNLAAMAGLDDGEFDFTARPGVGGPDEPAAGAAEIPGLLADLDDLGVRLDRQERQLSLLADLLVDTKLSEEVRPRGRPVKAGYISSYFGRRTDPFTGESRMHRGVDFAAKTGAEIVSVATGVVTWSGPRQGYGRLVEITHGDGYVTRYAHNAQNLVAVGDHVQQGDTIALMGATGRATGPHLHFEVWHQGRPVDPGRFIRQAVRDRAAFPPA